MTTVLDRPARAFGGPPADSRWATPCRIEPPISTRSRLLVVGDREFPDLAAVFAHLTIAWREAGQPLDVVLEHGTYPLAAAVRQWLDEHPCGHHLVTYDPNPWRGTVAIRPRAWRVLAFGQGWGVRVAEKAGLDVRRVGE